ncbi:MAG: T9SS type A sorting domain-containing protein [candidate division Zixibacteria bacterium]|nr:T9SS type A sorting domain-containing protein [candidate division Zixibacteria bacterium]
MPLLVEFYQDVNGLPDRGNPYCSYTFEIPREDICEASGLYMIDRTDIVLPTPCALLDGWLGVQGIGNGENIVFLWYNSTTGNGVNSYQWRDSVLVQTDYEQAFCLYSSFSGWLLNCDLTIRTPHVPAINGDLIFDFSVTNVGTYELPTIVGEVYPMIGDCPTGTLYDLDLIRTIARNLGPGETYTGNYFMHIDDVSGPGINTAALGAEVGEAPNNYYNWCCDEFMLINPWGRTGGEVSWGEMWYERGTDDKTPSSTSLGSNYPNPFNARTSIPFELSRAGNVTLKVYNLSGQVVETLVDGYMDAGQHSVTWNTEYVSSGIYFYSMELANEAIITMKMNLLK